MYLIYFQFYHSILRESSYHHTNNYLVSYREHQCYVIVKKSLLIDKLIVRNNKNIYKLYE